LFVNIPTLFATRNQQTGKFGEGICRLISKRSVMPNVRNTELLCRLVSMFFFHLSHVLMVMEPIECDEGFQVQKNSTTSIPKSSKGTIFLHKKLYNFI
jgi:hypothetical protein